LMIPLALLSIRCSAPEAPAAGSAPSSALSKPNDFEVPGPRDAEAQTTRPPVEGVLAREPAKVATNAASGLDSGQLRTPVEASGPDRAQDADALYAGTHKLGVNRVTDMARVGTATFSRKGNSLELEGRVARGKHWLELSGSVQPEGPKQFILTGVVRGVPDKSWAGEAPRERQTEGRFSFEVKHGRPYWRLYKVNDVPCVCDDECGNDFCYIDIELKSSP
jgi:hypothetical protein